MILNNTKDKVLARESDVYSHPLLHMKGLMFSRKREDFGLVFECPREQRQSLHMFFVFYPIDVLFLDENRRVVEIKKDFKPFTIHNSVKPAKYVVELPLGKSDHAKIGDIIEFDDN